MQFPGEKIEAIDRVLYGERWAPRKGWHDDHKHCDGTPEYRPAVMQVSAEFFMLAQVLCDLDLLRGRFLQLGAGECPASHALWCAIFDGGGVTLDLNGLYSNDATILSGGNTHDPAMRERVALHGPFDFLFIDAGHDSQDVMLDHKDYGAMVRPGGVIAFHDALPRYAYPEVEVWQYIRQMPGVTFLCASDVGTAYVIKKGG